MFDSRSEALLKNINKHFPSAKGSFDGEMFSCRFDDREELENMLMGSLDWNTLSSADLRECCDFLSYLTPSAFVRLLPVLIRAYFQSYDQLDVGVDSLFDGLTLPDSKTETGYIRKHELYKALSLDQKRIVYDFLANHVRPEDNDAAAGAIRSYWHK